MAPKLMKIMQKFKNIILFELEILFEFLIKIYAFLCKMSFRIRFRIIRFIN